MVSSLFVLAQSVLLIALGMAVVAGWDRELGLSPAAWMGAALCLGAVALALAALLSLGSSLQIAPAPRRGAKFVDRGVYRHLRHPMYTSVVAVAIVVCVIVPTAPVVTAALALIVFYLFKSRYEERLLLDHYPEYREYRTKTRGVLLLRGLP